MPIPSASRIHQTLDAHLRARRAHHNYFEKFISHAKTLISHPQFLGLDIKAIESTKDDFTVVFAGVQLKFLFAFPSGDRTKPGAINILKLTQPVGGPHEDEVLRILFDDQGETDQSDEFNHTIFITDASTNNWAMFLNCIDHAIKSP